MFTFIRHPATTLSLPYTRQLNVSFVRFFLPSRFFALAVALTVSLSENVSSAVRLP